MERGGTVTDNSFDEKVEISLRNNLGTDKAIEEAVAAGDDNCTVERERG